MVKATHCMVATLGEENISLNASLTAFMPLDCPDSTISTARFAISKALRASPETAATFFDKRTTASSLIFSFFEAVKEFITIV